MDRRVKPGGDDEGWQEAVTTAATNPLTSVAISVTTRESRPSRDVTGDSRLMGRVRFLRAGLVTPLPGGPGIDPAGITTGARGASLKRE
jgi:hypothetical protein